MSTREVVFASLMAPNATSFCRELCAYLGSAIGVQVRLIEEVDWQEAERRLHAGEAQLGVVCGLQYVRAVDADRAQARASMTGLSLVAAPVMSGARYLSRPVYFSDVVVRAASPFSNLEALRGARWAFNEPTSHSGCSVVRAALAARGVRDAFFGEIVASGAHQRSLAMLLAGDIDGTAVDSTVLEQALRDDPGLAEAIRVVEVLGPSPIPPLVASPALPAAIAAEVQQALLSMHTRPSGQKALEAGAMQRFVEVTDAEYNPIRKMAEEAAQLASWPVAPKHYNPARRDVRAAD